MESWSNSIPAEFRVRLGIYCANIIHLTVYGNDTVTIQLPSKQSKFNYGKAVDCGEKDIQIETLKDEIVCGKWSPTATLRAEQILTYLHSQTSLNSHIQGYK